MDKFFNPKSIAIVGATEKEGKVGFSLVKNLKNFQCKIYFVNINGCVINNNYVFKSLKEIEDHVDLAVIATPALTVPGVMRECASKRIKNVIIISSGFKETGNGFLEEELNQISKKNNIKILGPNCFGVFNSKNKLNVTFSKSLPLQGQTAFVSQSGALWSAVSEISVNIGLGFSKFVSLGDMSDIDFSDCVEYLSNDKETKTIVIYMEALNRGKKFMDVVKKCRKPVIVVKGGKTKGASEAALTHTGSLAGEYEIYKAALKQAGAYFVDSLYDALYLARFFDSYKLPAGKKVFVLTNAGGPGVLLSDLIEDAGFELVKLPISFKPKLSETCSLTNPLDVLGDADLIRFKEVFSKIKSKFFDYLVVILTPQEMTDPTGIANLIIDLTKKHNIVVLPCFLGGKSMVEADDLFFLNNIPCFSRLEDFGNLLKNLSRK